MHRINIPDWAFSHVIAKRNAALTAFYVTFGDVMTTDEVIHCIGATTTLKAAAG